MKNFNIPRTLADAQFAFNADPIERCNPRMARADRVVVWGSAIAAAALAVVLIVWR